MSLKIIALLVALFVCSCVSLKDKGRLYFTEGHKMAGIEPANIFLERMKADQQLRDVVYGQLKSAHVIECTILRNQIYVASLKNSDKEIEAAVKIMEPAYQANNEAFLTACDQIIPTNVGQEFLKIQHEYVDK